MVEYALAASILVGIFVIASGVLKSSAETRMLRIANFEKGFTPCGTAADGGLLNTDPLSGECF